MSLADVDVSVSEGVGLDERGVERVQRVAEQALVALGRAEDELSVLLCDDATIQPLNRDWRGKDKPTDVLSFPQVEGEIGDGPELLGDVVISLDTAARQAAERGHSVEAEVDVLLVHGLLHLLGYDHHDPEEEADMRAEEARVLAALGRDPVGLVERAALA
jgi:probable rRNA maturation factor